MVALAACSHFTRSPSGARQPDWVYAAAQGQWINWLSTSASGDVIVTGTYRPGKVDDYAVFALNRKGQLLWSDPVQKANGGVFWTDVTPDGNYAAAGGLLEEADASAGKLRRGFLRVYETRPFKKILELETKGRLNSLQFSRDGRWLVAGTGSGQEEEPQLCLLGRTRGGYAVADRFFSPQMGFRSVSISSDGRWIAGGTIGGRVSLLENVRGTLVERSRWAVPQAGPKGAVRFVRMSPDGRWIAVATNSKRTALFEREEWIKRGEPIWTMSAPDGPEVYAVALSADGRFVAASSNADNETGEGGGYVQLFESSRDSQSPSGWVARERWVFRTPRFNNPGLVFDEQARLLTVSSGFPVGTAGHFFLIDRESGVPMWSYQHPEMGWPMILSADASSVLIGTDDAKVLFFDLGSP